MRLNKRCQKLSEELEETQIDHQAKSAEVNELSLYLKKILKNIGQGIIFVNTASIITTYSTAAARILEIDHKDVLLQNYQQAFDDNFFGFSMKEALETLKLQSGITRAYKNEKTIVVSVGFIRHGSINKRGVFLFLRDITQVEKLQRELPWAIVCAN